MRRNRRNNAKKERIIMVASSVFVLSALTMTGIYMKSNHAEQQDDGYTIDFTALEDNVQDKYQEIAQNNQADNEQIENNQIGSSHADTNVVSGQKDYGLEMSEWSEVMDDDLDYMPMEVGSGQVEIPGLADSLLGEEPVDGNTESGNTENNKAEVPVESNTVTVPEPEPEPEQESAAANAVAAVALHFTENDILLRPLEGEVLIPFNMDATVYFRTLNHYKRNPAMVIAAEQGTPVIAGAEGKVIDIFKNEVIGNAVTLDLGDGYQITYGQLENINVTLDSYVQSGEVIAAVAAPTKYYVSEGSNLYLKLTVDGMAVNPESLFR